MDTAQDALIAVTDAAALRLKGVAEREGVDFGTTYLRVAVVPGGCSGMTYDLGWDTVRQDTDDLVESHGLRILLDARSAAYVEGTTLDFSDGLDGRGFHFANPNAVRTCACGDSFGL